ncbi:glycoside hydrolase [Lojkania enalia]|uniref:chitinase n=1 Tax=Lojkania enalia TaxID=147567 RepID=A0A9P4KHK7_9PLEO|nr:glycoside hydrolase [Didymosphaeria enalia]
MKLRIAFQYPDVDIILVSFLIQFNGPGDMPVLNLANQGDKCETITGTNLFKCPEVETDIQYCQIRKGKTILLSLGGAVYTEAGFTSPEAATTAADKIWAIFGPPQNWPHPSDPRPFGYASLDGFDFDFESTVSNMEPFASRLRQRIDEYTSRTGRHFFLTAAPQCVFPDQADKDIIDNVPLDMLFIQFYNNFCGVKNFAAGHYNFDTWAQWAREKAPNRNVRLYVGVPASSSAGGGYVHHAELGKVIGESGRSDKFGGVMVWDASQAWANEGFLDGVKRELRQKAGKKTAREMRFGVRPATKG